MKEKSRTPMSQQPLTIEKPILEDGIGSKVTVEINEKKVQVFFGQTILDACKENQIHVPTLCHHPDLCICSRQRRIISFQIFGFET